MTDSFMGRQMNRVMQDSIGKMIKGQENTPTGLTMTTMAKEMPLRSIAMGGGPLNLAKLRAILLMINGHMFLGIKALFRNK
jgi:hypothetical protein